MFGLSKKERAAEAVRRGALASLTGAYLHQSQIEQLHLNKAASSWLYTEALAHHFHTLGTVFSHALSSSEKWATEEFFASAAKAAYNEHEAKHGLPHSSLVSFIFPRFGVFQVLSGPERVAGEHFNLSASSVHEKDPNANIGVLVRMLRESTEKYAQDARRLFGV